MLHSTWKVFVGEIVKQVFHSLKQLLNPTVCKTLMIKEGKNSCKEF